MHGSCEPDNRTERERVVPGGVFPPGEVWRGRVESKS